MSEKISNSEIGYYNNQLNKFPNLSIEDITEDYGKDSEKIKQEAENREKIELNKASILEAIWENPSREVEIFFHNEKWDDTKEDGGACATGTEMTDKYGEVYCYYSANCHLVMLDEKFSRIGDNPVAHIDYESDEYKQASYICSYTHVEANYYELIHDNTGQERSGKDLNDGTSEIEDINIYLA